MAWVGRFVVRFRYPVIAVWILATVFCIRAFPSLGSVVNSDNSSFLQSSAPSKQAAQLTTAFQPGNTYTSVIVAARDGGPLTPADQAAITRAETAAGAVKHVRFVHDQGVSADGHARKALVGIDVSPSDSRAGGVVDRLRSELSTSGAPAGLQLHLTGAVASNVDNSRAAADANKLTSILTNVVILIMLVVVFRAVLAPLVTLFPAVLVLLLAGPVIAQASSLGFQVSSFTQVILTVLVLGAGTDYGLFLILRVREELGRGHSPRDAVIEAVDKVGESISFSGGTVIGALLCLLLASFGVYRGLGPGLAIGIALMLLAALTLLPAMLSVLGHAIFWPLRVEPGEAKVGAWGRIAVAIVQRPITTLVAGVVFFGLLAALATGYVAGGFASSSSGPSGSDSLQGSTAIAAHYPPAVVNPTTVILVFPASVWNDLDLVQSAERALSQQPVFRSVSGLLDPNGTSIQSTQLSELHAQLGDPSKLPPSEPAAVAAQVPLADYNAYRSTAQFVSSDGRTVQFYTTLTAGDPASYNGAAGDPLHSPVSLLSRPRLGSECQRCGRASRFRLRRQQCIQLGPAAHRAGRAPADSRVARPCPAQPCGAPLPGAERRLLLFRCVGRGGAGVYARQGRRWVELCPAVSDVRVPDGARLRLQHSGDEPHPGRVVQTIAARRDCPGIECNWKHSDLSGHDSGRHIRGRGGDRINRSGSPAGSRYLHGRLAGYLPGTHTARAVDRRAARALELVAVIPGARHIAGSRARAPERGNSVTRRSASHRGVRLPCRMTGSRRLTGAQVHRADQVCLCRYSSGDSRCWARGPGNRTIHR